MTGTFHIGGTVESNWATGTGRGRIIEWFTCRATRRIDATEAKRHASKLEPACLIEQDDRERVLKSSTELS